MAYVGTYLALTAALLALFQLSGFAATRRLLRMPESAALDERAALGLVAGLGVWIAILFALAALQRLRPAPIAAAIAAVIVWGGWSWWRERARRLEREPGRDRNDPPPGAAGRTPAAAPMPATTAVAWSDPFLVLLLVMVATAIAALAVQALRPIVGWDADVYHLTIPRLYLEHGGFRRIPFNVYSDWPLGMELLFALSMVLKDYVLATLLHFALGVALIALVGLAVARAATPLWGAIAAAMLLLHPVLLFEIRVAYVDVACALFLFAAFLALHRALEEPASERQWLALAGVACGVLAATKLSGVFGAVCIGVVHVASRLHAGTRPRALVAPLAAFAAPIVLLGLPWIAKSLWATGNPVYPLLYHWFGGPEWSEALGRAHRDWQQGIGMGRSPLDFLLLPFRVLFLGAEGYEHFDGRLHPLAGILLPVAIVAAWSDALVRRALAVAAIWFAVWAATSQQMRFLIPVLPLLALATTVGGQRLAERHLPRAAQTWLPRGLALLLIVLLPVANARFLRQAPSLLPALWAHSDELRLHSTDDVFPVIDQRLPSSAKLLFVNVNRGFFCRREYIADSFFEASQTVAMLHRLAEQGGVRQGLRELGVTHVLVENRSRGLDYPKEFVDLLSAPGSRTIYQSPDGRFTLIALPS